MNMKKTMAAIAACAVATSAMATTATTAFAEGSVTYNLVHQTYKRDPGTVTHRAVVNAPYTSGTEGQYLNIIFKKSPKFVDGTEEAINANIKWSVNAYGLSQGNKMDPVKFNNYVALENTWSANASEWINQDWSNYAVLSIPLDKTGLNIEGTVADAIYCDVSITVEHNDGDSWNYAPFVDAEVAYLVSTDNGAGNPYWPGLGTMFADGQKVDVTESNKSAVGDWVPDAKYPMMTDINTNTVKKQGNYTQVADNDIYFPTETRLGTKFTLKNVSGSSSNILSYLSDPTFNLVGKDKSYVNVVPVLNDIIANYDDVTFTFNTATEAVGLDFSDDDKSESHTMIIKTEIKAGTEEIGTDANGNPIYNAVAEVTEKAEEFKGYKYGGFNADSQYTKFAQHLYNFYGDETTGYVYTDAYDWTGYTLFSGALVINGNLSMSLQDTNVFDFGASSISFNWADATEGATVNTYVNYLTKMQLATSTKWFWDNMVVSYANTEVEDVASDAGAEAEEDVIEDEVVEDEIVEDEIVEDEIVEEAPVVEEPVVEEVAPAPVTNPSTGNAPIALAVIPVALAAAAVVAKKRG